MRQPGRDQLLQAWLVQRRLSAPQSLHHPLVEIQPDDRVASGRHASGGDTPEVPQAEDRDAHGGC